jgi:hypothetical protein
MNVEIGSCGMTTRLPFIMCIHAHPFVQNPDTRMLMLPVRANQLVLIYT